MTRWSTVPAMPSSSSTAIPIPGTRWPQRLPWRHSTSTRKKSCSTARAGLNPFSKETLHALADKPNVIDVRNIGLAGAIELAPRDGASGRTGQRCLRSGLRSGSPRQGPLGTSSPWRRRSWSRKRRSTPSGPFWRMSSTTPSWTGDAETPKRANWAGRQRFGDRLVARDPVQSRPVLTATSDG